MGTGKATRKDPNEQGFDIGKGQGKVLFQKGLLDIMTSGTSEIKTGGGQYGDETVADSLFPKTVNDMMLNERQAAREDADAAASASAAAQSPNNGPDRTDILLGKTTRQRMSAGRRSSFLTGPGGDMSKPPVGSSILGGK